MAIRYVVMGKRIPRSTGFRSRSTAEKYLKEFGGNGRIYIRTESQLKKRFFKRFHNTKSYREKIKRRRK